MKHRQIATALMAGGLLVSAAGVAGATPQDPRPTQPTNQTPAPATSADRDTTQKVRKAIMDNKSLSTNAHNVKIDTRDGRVTLRGAVRSEDEKHSVVEAAASVVGAANVTDELTLRPAK